jgi:hypothetical protein
VRWEFGAPALPQTVAAADLLRRVTAHVLAMERDEPEVEHLVAVLAEAEERLAALAPTDTPPRVGDAVDGAGRVYLDHSRDIGAFNPCFPDYEIVVVDDEHAHGRVRFPIAYEGPPGLVHGGFLALLFDCVVQHHNCDVGVAGKTASLALRFRRPTPLLTELTFTIDRRVEGDRITSSARILGGDVVLAEAEVVAVAGDRARLPAVSERRTRP